MYPTIAQSDIKRIL
jgi:hypothetical protein